MYIWSRETILTLAARIKEKFPSLTIVLGGPEVDAHINPMFYRHHPYIDYCIYGDGEESFSLLLDYIAGHNVELVNLVFRNKIYSHTVFNDRKVLDLSPFITYSSEIKEHLNTIHADLIKVYKINDLELSGDQAWKKIVLVWETTKGCPYSCSFCDWSSGLHNKVRVWGDKSQEIPYWQQEIDLFFSWNIYYIYWTNPNVGLTPQDRHIVKYWCEKRLNNKRTGPKIYAPQWSKLKKDVVFELLDLMLSSGVTEFFKADLQDLDTDVLEKIDRPEVPWEIHREYIKKLLTKHNITSNANWQHRLNFIWGLPGQTLDNLRTNLEESGKLKLYGHHLPFELIPMSPAAKPAYIEKFKIKIDRVTVVGHSDVFKNESLSRNWTIDRAVISNSSLSEKEWFTGIFLFYVYVALSSKLNLHGRETRIIDNRHRIQSTIDKSFQYFLTTRRIAIEISGTEKSIYQYVENNIDDLRSFYYLNDECG